MTKHFKRLSTIPCKFTFEIDLHHLEIKLPRPSLLAIGILQGPHRVVSRPFEYVPTKLQQHIDQRLAMAVTIYMDSSRLVHQQKEIRIFLLVTPTGAPGGGAGPGAGAGAGAGGHPNSQSMKADGEAKLDLGSLANFGSKGTH